MYYIGLDVHKKTISYCVKDAAGKIHQEGKIGSTRRELDGWIKTLPRPRMKAMEATIFTGWIYDHLLTMRKSPKRQNGGWVISVSSTGVCIHSRTRVSSRMGKSFSEDELVDSLPGHFARFPTENLRAEGET